MRGIVCPRPALRAVAIVVGVVVLAGTAACSSGDEAPDEPPPEVADSWARTDVWEHSDVLAYDRVAVGASPDTLAWVTRRGQGDTGALAYAELRGNGEPTAVDLADPTPPAAPPGAPPAAAAAGSDQVLIPVATACGDSLWAALAVTRDSPRGDNTGLVAWQGARSPDGFRAGTGGSAGAGQAAVPATRLPLPDGVDGVPEAAGAAVMDETAVAVALVGNDPVVWHSTGDGSAAAADRWVAVDGLDLDVTGDVVSLRVSADAERFVLAAVDRSGHARLWTSTDGDEWSAVEAGNLPDSSGGVALLNPVSGGRIVVGWFSTGDGEAAPNSAAEITVQSVDGDQLVDEGTVAADDEHNMARVDVNAASLSPDDRLVLVGAAVRPSNEVVPMVWAQDGDRWTASEQTELAGRIDYEMRAAVPTRDALVALVTNRTHIDVESWHWQRPE